MINLRADSLEIPLGQALRLAIDMVEPGVATRLFLRHDGVRYTRPWRDWDVRSTDNLLLEAPGRYRIYVDWRTKNGDSGRHELDFEVQASPSPEISTNSPLRDQGLVRAPSEWEAGLLQGSEHAQLGQLDALLAPGAVFYDVGANLGVYSLAASRRVGSQGRVYSFEANPVCVQYLRANMQRSGAENVEILPVALLDKEGHVPFRLNYGNTQLGLVESSPHYGGKGGHEILVPTAALDTLADSLSLDAPQVVKVDVEGAEEQVVAGMYQTLARHQPALLLELHGLDCAEPTLALLDALDYGYRDARSAATFASGADVCKRFGDTVFQIVGVPGGTVGA